MSDLANTPCIFTGNDFSHDSIHVLGAKWSLEKYNYR